MRLSVLCRCHSHIPNICSCDKGGTWQMRSQSRQPYLACQLVFSFRVLLLLLLISRRDLFLIPSCRRCSSTCQVEESRVREKGQWRTSLLIVCTDSLLVRHTSAFSVFPP